MDLTHQIIRVIIFQNYEKGGTCDRHEGKEKYIQGFGGEI
jgi:hypothetical protein